jgi:hypothetical protein
MAGGANTHFSLADKQVAGEIWKANVPLKSIRKQLNMSERSLRRILAFAKKNPDAPVQERMQWSGRPSKVKAADLKAMESILKTTPTATANKLKERVPGLENVSVKTVLNHGEGVCADPGKEDATLGVEGPGTPERESEHQLPDRGGGKT